MICPKCYDAQTMVIDSRDKNDPIYVKRKRRCPKCEYAFITIEMFIRDVNRYKTREKASQNRL